VTQIAPQEGLQGPQERLGPQGRAPQGPVAEEPRTLTVTVTGPDKWLSSNGREHHMPRARATKEWQLISQFRTRQAMRDTSTGQMGAAELDITVHWPDKRRRDAHNTAPTWKAAIDGAVAAGLLADDSDRYLRAVTIRATVTAGTRPRMDMTWTEVGA